MGNTEVWLELSLELTDFPRHLDKPVFDSQESHMILTLHFFEVLQLYCFSVALWDVILHSYQIYLKE